MKKKGKPKNNKFKIYLKFNKFLSRFVFNICRNLIVTIKEKKQVWDNIRK